MSVKSRLEIEIGQEVCHVLRRIPGTLRKKMFYNRRISYSPFTPVPNTDSGPFQEEIECLLKRQDIISMENTMDTLWADTPTVQFPLTPPPSPPALYQVPLLYPAPFPPSPVWQISPAPFHHLNHFPQQIQTPIVQLPPPPNPPICTQMCQPIPQYEYHDGDQDQCSECRYYDATRNLIITWKPSREGHDLCTATHSALLSNMPQEARCCPGIVAITFGTQQETLDAAGR